MRDQGESTFQISVIELFIVILFITILFSFNKISEQNKKLNNISVKLDESQELIEQKDSLISYYKNSKNALSDSLELFYGKKERLLDLEKDKNKKEGSGIGACWKVGESSVSILHVTFYDSYFDVERAWPDAYDFSAKIALGDNLYNKFTSQASLNIPAQNFTNTLNTIKRSGELENPRCYHIADISDSTSTKRTYLKQEQIASQVFVLNKKYLYSN